MVPSELPDWERLLPAERHLEALLPRAVLVGGSAAILRATMAAASTAITSWKTSTSDSMGDPLARGGCRVEDTAGGLAVWRSGRRLRNGAEDHSATGSALPNAWRWTSLTARPDGVGAVSRCRRLL